jgi:phospholipid transport system substrate-binding protein
MQPKNRHRRIGIAALGIASEIIFATALLPRVSLAADTPRTVVEATAQQTLEILNSAADDAEKIKRLQRVAYQSIDFETVTRLVLAKYWKQFTPEQRQEFQDEFKRALTISYGRRIGQFGREKVVILGQRPEPLGDVTVQSRIVGKTGDVKADYRLRQKGDTWYVIDVTVEGVSIVSSYRTQFQEIIGQGGPQQLLAELRAKNASGQGLTLPETARSGA